MQAFAGLLILILAILEVVPCSSYRNYGVGNHGPFITPFSAARRYLSVTDRTSQAFTDGRRTIMLATPENTLDGRGISGPLKPILDYVLIEKKDWAKESDGGVILAQQSKKEQSIGKVLAVGDGAYSSQTGARLPMVVHAGDWVLYSPYGDSFKYNGRECIVARGDLVQAVIKNKDGELKPNELQPLHDSVFLKIIKSRTKTDSGLILSATEKPESNVIGSVIAVGNGTYSDTGTFIPVEISVGDHVQFPDYASSNAEMKIDGENYAVVRQRDVMLKW